MKKPFKLQTLSKPAKIPGQKDYLFLDVQDSAGDRVFSFDASGKEEIEIATAVAQLCTAVLNAYHKE